MSPDVEAAIIAGSVGILTLIGTVATQLHGIQRNSRDIEKSREEQREQLDRTFAEEREQLERTLAEQREQLGTTLAEQREQLDRTLAEQRVRTLNERFATAADQLGSDKPPAVRLAGVYAMAGLADDWAENRQTCVDVLCAYLRLPYMQDPGENAAEADRLAFRSSREVTRTAVRIIAAHLRREAEVSWQGLNLDFTGVVFDSDDFSGAVFSGGRVDFSGAVFPGGRVTFHRAVFSGAKVDFAGAVFSGGTVSFSRVKFSGGTVSFSRAQFSSSRVSFGGGQFSGGTVSFSRAVFSGGLVYFGGAQFTGGTAHFNRAEFSGAAVYFTRGVFFGGTVDFVGAQFSGGTVSFDNIADWSHPPTFSWNGAPPAGVVLPVASIGDPP